MAASDVPADWDPLKDHFKTSNVYRANKVVTQRDGSESEVSDGKEKDLFIANIPIRITTDGLINLLGEAGKILEIRLIPDKKNSQCQLAFVKTFSSADGLRIIEQFHNFKIGNNILRVHVQKPRKVENSSDSGHPPFGQSHAAPTQTNSAPTQTNSAPSCQPESSPTPPESRSDGSRLSSSPFGDDKLKPVGRSKLILATALRHQSHEPQVGQLRAGSTRPTNGSNHRRSSGQSGSSSSDEIGSREKTKEKNDKQQESQRLALDCVNKQPDKSSQAAKNVSEKVTPKPQVCRTGPCLRCKKFGDKNCSKCRGVYCSKVCQLADFQVHRLICMPYSKDEDEFQKRFEFMIDSVTERDPEVSEIQSTILQVNIPVKVACLVPAMSPSRFFVLPDSNKNQLDKLSLLLNEHYAVAKNCQPPDSSPDMGDVCACKYSADDLWYRVEVEEVATRSRVIIRYIDYGNEEEVEMSSLCELPRQLKAIPKLAVLCGLANIEPIPSEGGSRWSKKAIQLSQKYIQQCIAVITPISTVAEVCNVEIKIDDSDGTDVAEKLVDAGVARYTEKNRPTRDSAGKLSSPRPSPSPKSNQLPSPRSSQSPAQLPSSGPSPSPNELSSSYSPLSSQLPSPSPSPSPTQLPSSKPLPSPGELPSSMSLLSAKKPLPPVSPSTMELSGFEVPNVSKFGWPADLSNMVGKQMSFQVVEYSPPGGLWVRISPLPGHETMPLVRLSLTERYRLTPEPRPSSSRSSPPPLTPKPPESVEPVEPKWHRVKVSDLPALQLKAELKVEVTLPKNPADFWCHDLEQMAPIMELQNSMKPDASPLPRSFQPEYSDICFGLYKKYNEWYRVMVLERKHDSVDAFLIDYGENISIPLTDLRPLPLELSLYPPMAFQCQLSVWKSLQTSSCDVVKHFQDLIQNKAVSCKILGHNAVTGMRSVILSDFQSGQSVASVLIDAIEKNAF